MVGGGGASPADEQIVAGFSGRFDGRVGRFRGRPDADQWEWDEHLEAILGYPGHEGSVSLPTLLQCVVEDDRPLAADAFQAAIDHGDPVRVSCRLHTADCTVRSVLITADLSDDDPHELSMFALPRTTRMAAATGPWLVGHVIDLTTLRLGAARAAANHAVTEAAKHRAVIEQAKGMLMLTYRIDADTAFQLLRRHSQNTNTKLHDLAAHLVSHVTTLCLDTAPAQIDTLLQQPR